MMAHGLPCSGRSPPSEVSSSFLPNRFSTISKMAVFPVFRHGRGGHFALCSFICQPVMSDRAMGIRVDFQHKGET